MADKAFPTYFDERTDATTAPDDDLFLLKRGPNVHKQTRANAFQGLARVNDGVVLSGSGPTVLSFATHGRRVVYLDGASDHTILVHTGNGFTPGAWVQFVQRGTGKIILTQGTATVTLASGVGAAETAGAAGDWAIMDCIGTDAFVVSDRAQSSSGGPIVRSTAEEFVTTNTTVETQVASVTLPALVAETARSMRVTVAFTLGAPGATTEVWFRAKLGGTVIAAFFSNDAHTGAFWGFDVQLPTRTRLIAAGAFENPSQYADYVPPIDVAVDMTQPQPLTITVEKLSSGVRPVTFKSMVAVISGEAP